jgi:pimeloyl-ACP methyl ester carboxylesterase
MAETTTVGTQAALGSTQPLKDRTTSIFDLFCTPQPAPEQTWERNVLAAATQVGTVAHADDDLPVYRWGHGPTVVLTHGWGARATHMGPLARALAAAGFTAVAFDGPAHTRAAIAGRARQQATFVDFARALQAVTELVAPVHGLVGHSAGGAATAFAASGFADTLATTPDLPPSSAQGPNPTTGVDRLVLMSAPDHLAGVIETWARLSGTGTQIIEPLHQETFRRFGKPVEAFSVSAHAHLLPARTLLVHDGEDMRVPISEAQRVDGALGGGRLLTTRGLGHSRTLTDPNVATHVVAYLEEH